MGPFYILLDEMGLDQMGLDKVGMHHAWKQAVTFNTAKNWMSQSQ